MRLREVMLKQKDAIGVTDARARTCRARLRAAFIRPEMSRRRSACSRLTAREPAWKKVS